MVKGRVEGCYHAGLHRSEVLEQFNGGAPNAASRAQIHRACTWVDASWFRPRDQTFLGAERCDLRRHDGATRINEHADLMSKVKLYITWCHFGATCKLQYCVVAYTIGDAYITFRTFTQSRCGHTPNYVHRNSFALDFPFHLRVYSFVSELPCFSTHLHAYCGQ
jgi:hypothetical protein